MATLLRRPAPDPVDPGAVAGAEHAVDEPVVAGQVVLGQQADLEGGLGDAGQARLVRGPRLLVEVAPQPVRDVVVGEPFLGDGRVTVVQAAASGCQLVQRAIASSIVASSAGSVTRAPARAPVGRVRTCTRVRGDAARRTLCGDADRDRDALRDARCARAARCRAWSRRTTTACTSSSSAAPGRVRGRSSPSGWPASSAGRSASPSRTSSRVEVDRALGDAEPDEEIHDLVRASGGLNLGMDFLPGALAFNPAAARARRGIDPDVAADIVWLDALVTNPDRTVAEPEPPARGTAGRG